MMLKKKIQHTIPVCIEGLRLNTLKSEIKKYGEHAVEKRAKLKRIFSYLLVPPFRRKNLVMDGLLKDTHDLLRYATTDHLRASVLLACIQSINHYKIAGYSTALAFAIDLNLDAVADLLHEILVWEKETNSVLTKIAFEELNKKETTSLPS